MTNISLNRITYSFDGSLSPTLKGISLEVQPGEMLGLLGPSGCGKTTTLRVIAGLIKPTTGSISYDGECVDQVPPEKRGAVMVSQGSSLFPFMNIRENIGFGLKMRKMAKHEIKRRTEEMLEVMRLTGIEERYPKELSGGQTQRAALARALVIRPKILLLDEPLSSLDAHLRDEIRNLILDLHHRYSLTTVFVTHDQEEAVQLSDRIALMFQGELRQVGPPEAFYAAPVTRDIAEFFGSSNFLPGQKKGSEVSTPVGNLEISKELKPDGEVTLTVRPESILFQRSGKNCFKAEIIQRLYLGTHMSYKVRTGEWLWTVVAPPEDGVTYGVGDLTWLTIPKERIHLLNTEKEIDL